MRAGPIGPKAILGEVDGDVGGEPRQGGDAGPPATTNLLKAVRGERWISDAGPRLRGSVTADGGM